MWQLACVPAWFTCQRACMPRCQKRAKFSLLCANVRQGVAMFQLGMPTCQTACQFFNSACQRAKEHANFLNAKGNLYTLLLYKIFYIILDIILIHVMYVFIVHISCIILYFLKLFCSLDRNGNIKTPGFYTIQVTREYCDLLGL